MDKFLWKTFSDTSQDISTSKLCLRLMYVFFLSPSPTYHSSTRVGKQMAEFSKK